MSERKMKCEQADGRSGGVYHTSLKVRKRRYERRKAKSNPNCNPTYGALQRL